MTFSRVLVLGAVVSACALQGQRGTDDGGPVVKSARATEKAAVAVGHATATAYRKTVGGTKAAAGATADATVQAGKATAKGTKTAVSATGKGVTTGVTAVGKGVGTGLQKTGDGIAKAGDKVKNN